MSLKFLNGFNILELNIKSGGSILKHYQNQISKKIQICIRKQSSEDRLLEACQYALSDNGKRVRPALVLMISEALNSTADVLPAALAIEYFHTASLVADDLPCMDDDDERRDKPSVHKIYGEGLALLTSYALIAAGFGAIAESVENIRKSGLPYAGRSDLLGMMALENAAFNTGLQGATGGQFLDIFPPNLSIPLLREVIHKKTVSLFEIAFVFGWLFGGGDLELLPTLKQAASHFGFAFQIADDFGDMEQDAKNERKVNIVAVLGKERGKEMFQKEILGYKKALKRLNLESPNLLSLAVDLENQLGNLNAC